jgi:predicted 3-demethylubiquinone-9 3-methyltransferase (glyoxalase superfamily)
MYNITPFLWFDDKAEEAAHFYVSVFAGTTGKRTSKITSLTRYGDEGPGPKGTVMTAVFKLDGREFIALNGGPRFSFNESVSFVINCKNQKEVDYFWEKLSEGGEKSMCGWVKDKYGLWWQVVPTILGTLFRSRNKERSGRVMQAMLQMSKLDIKALKQAYGKK